MWFAEDFADKIGRITPAGVGSTEYPVPKGAHAWNMAPGPDGNVWFTTDNKWVGRISPSGHIRLFDISSLQHGFSFTEDIAAGGDGALWFTGLNGIGALTPDGSQMSLFPLPPGVAALRITEGPGGDLWFTGGGTGQVGRMRVNGNVKTFAVPGSVFLFGIGSGPDDSVWFTDETNPSKVGEVTAAGQVHVFQFGPGGNAGLQGIAQGPDGNLWVTETNEHALGRVLPDGSWTQFAMRWPHSLTWRIALGADGAMWFTDGGRNQIGRITVAAAPAIALDRDSGGPGDEITITGEHFGALEKVRIGFQSGAGSPVTMTRARTDANGSFEAVANVPPGVPPGPATIRARGVTSHISSTASFEVSAQLPGDPVLNCGAELTADIRSRQGRPLVPRRWIRQIRAMGVGLTRERRGGDGSRPGPHQETKGEEHEEDRHSRFGAGARCRARRIVLRNACREHRLYERTELVRPNTFVQSTLRWDPGTVDVNSGARLKFVYANKGREPHTISVVNQDQLPATVGQVFRCEVCSEIFDIQDGHKRVLGADGGFNEFGDTIFFPAGATTSVKITAPKGTTLFFLCAIHPWMQGKILVT